MLHLLFFLYSCQLTSFVALYCASNQFTVIISHRKCTFHSFFFTYYFYDFFFFPSSVRIKCQLAHFHSPFLPVTSACISLSLAVCVSYFLFMIHYMHANGADKMLTLLHNAAQCIAKTKQQKTVSHLQFNGVVHLLCFNLSYLLTFYT